MKLLSCVRLLVTSWTAAHQAPLSMGFSRHEYRSGVPSPSLPLCLTSWNVCEKPLKGQRLEHLARANMGYARVSQRGHHCYSGLALSRLCWAVPSTVGYGAASLVAVPWVPEAPLPNPCAPSLYSYKCGRMSLGRARLPPLGTAAARGSISGSRNPSSHHSHSSTGLVFT